MKNGGKAREFHSLAKQLLGVEAWSKHTKRAWSNCFFFGSLIFQYFDLYLSICILQKKNFQIVEASFFTIFKENGTREEFGLAALGIEQAKLAGELFKKVNFLINFC